MTDIPALKEAGIIALSDDGRPGCKYKIYGRGYAAC